MNKFWIGFICFVAIYGLSTCQRNTISSTHKADELMIQKDRDRWLQKMKTELAGKENRMVDSVYSNLKVLSGFEAENLVFAMEAWSKALGVSCGHCHDTRDFAADIKSPKTIARKMVTLGDMISAELKQIPGLSQRPIVNCITCHRGSLKPAYRLNP
jgi:hypothetical protein